MHEQKSFSVFCLPHYLLPNDALRNIVSLKKSFYFLDDVHDLEQYFNKNHRSSFPAALLIVRLSWRRRTTAHWFSSSLQNSVFSPPKCLLPVKVATPISPCHHWPHPLSWTWELFSQDHPAWWGLEGERHWDLSLRKPLGLWILGFCRSLQRS